jgi:hypothetical protein
MSLVKRFKNWEQCLKYFRRKNVGKVAIFLHEICIKSYSYT